MDVGKRFLNYMFYFKLLCLEVSSIDVERAGFVLCLHAMCLPGLSGGLGLPFVMFPKNAYFLTLCYSLTVNFRLHACSLF